MDNYREVEILPVKAVGASGTETLDIAIDEPVTALYVFFRAVNGAVTAPNVPPALSIDKIEIVDGGKVYYSLNGPEAIATAVYDNNRWPSHFYSEVADNGQYEVIPLLFGRYLGDEEFMFSAAKLLNPQLKITWTRNALHAATPYTLGVRVKAMQGVTPGSKCLMVKNVRTFNSAATGVEITDLPVDYDIRRMYIRVYGVMQYWAEALTHLKLDCDVGRLIMFDMDQQRFLDTIRETFPTTEHQLVAAGVSSVWKESWLGNIMGCAVNSGTAGYIASGWSANAGRWQPWLTTDAGVAVDNQPLQTRVWGYLPHYTLAYQFGRKDDPASWFRASRFGQVRLELTQGEADHAFSIFLQRVTPLP